MTLQVAPNPGAVQEVAHRLSLSDAIRSALSATHHTALAPRCVDV